MKYSLVIPVLNEEEFLPDLFASISNLSPAPFEIQIIDGGSFDNSCLLISQLRSTLDPSVNLYIYHNPGGLPGSNRNIGITKSTTEWVAFLDVGTIPNEDWINNLIISLKNNNANHAYALCKFYGKTSFQNAVCALTYGCNSKLPTLPGGIFHSTLFEADKVGLFNPDLRAAEDQLWMKKLHIHTPKNISFNARINYSDFPVRLIDCLNKTWTYQINQNKAGVALLRLWIFPFFYFIFIPLVVFVNIRLGLAIISCYLFFRGIIDPMRRANNIFWFKLNPKSFWICLWLGILIDFTKASSLALQIFRKK